MSENLDEERASGVNNEYTGGRSFSTLVDNLTSPILVVKCTDKLSIYQIRI